MIHSIQRYFTRATALVILLGLSVFSCKEAEEQAALEVNAAFNIANKITAEAPLTAPANVRLTNASKNGLAYSWEFLDGGFQKNDKLKATTFKGVQPDTLLYELPGTYRVRLTVTTQGEPKVFERTIEVKKPALNFTSDALLMRTPGKFKAVYFKYPGKAVTFAWQFEGGVPATSAEEQPVVTFALPGSKVVKLTINDGVETLVKEMVVDVKGELAKTIYFTDMATGFVWRKSLAKTVPSAPEKLALAAGKHPFTLSIDGENLFLMDVGSKVAGAAATNVDGLITRSKLDGTGTQTVISNFVGTSDAEDPFAATISGGDILYASRLYGVYQVSKTATGVDHATAKRKLFDIKKNAGANSIIATNAGMQVLDGKYYVSKSTHSERGIWVLENTGFAPGATAQRLSGHSVKAFYIDKVSNKIFFTIAIPGTLKTGMYMCDIDGNNIKPIDVYDTGVFDGNGGGAELYGITAIAVDNEAGYVYWAFRAEDANATTHGDASKSGIKRAKLDGTGVEMYIPGVVTYGLAIEHVKR